MPSLNKVILIGNLTADPEFKTTPSGVSVTTFTIAVERRFAKPGDAVTADFIRVMCWRHQAEFASKYFNKGKSIVIVGSIQTRSWTDQNGQKRYSTEVVADEVTFGSTKSENEPKQNEIDSEAEYSEKTTPEQENAVTPAANFEELGKNDDLPF